MPKVETKKYVSPAKSTRTLRKKRPKAPEGGKNQESNYLRMLQLLAAPTTRPGGSTVDAAFAGAARGLAMAQLLKSMGGDKSGKVGASPLEAVKPSKPEGTGAGGGLGKAGNAFKPQKFGGGMV